MPDEAILLTKEELAKLYSLLQKPLPANAPETIPVGRFSINKKDIIDYEYRNSIAAATRDRRRQQAQKYYQNKRTNLQKLKTSKTT